MTLFHIVLIILFVTGLTMYIYCKIVHDTPSNFFELCFLSVQSLVTDAIIFLILYILYNMIVVSLINTDWHNFFNYKVICF